MKERVIVSATTFVISLGSYLYSKHLGKDAIPYLMIGGFVGAVLGESIAMVFSKEEDKDGKEEN
jgi:hypothetical protein